MASNEQDYIFTCLSCSIAFLSAEDQRAHYRSDHHRYNMKRRVAQLPPVSAAVFDQKVLDRRAETAVAASPKGRTCEVCSKTYTTENAYRSHLNSNKHKEREAKGASIQADAASKADEPVEELESSLAAASIKDVPAEPEPKPHAAPSLTIQADATEEEIIQTLDEKIAAARSRIAITDCLFCTTSSSSLDENIAHMSSAHSFFIPDQEFLVDLAGLIRYLGEKIAVGNVCIYCNGKGREFRTVAAVRKHMTDKSHCKIAYDSESDRLEVSDYYDFSTSYPDAEKRSSRPKVEQESDEEEEWEDTDDEDLEDADEVVDEDSGAEDSDELPDNNITYGDTPYELVLPSGSRIGHRSMKRYYAQSFRPSRSKTEDPNSGAAIVRRLIADKDSALIPRKGGYGAYGVGTEVIKARNRGEAREAGRHVREFRDQRRREDFKTKVGFIHNSQKHFRDPLLQ
ncbi:hypothetical protein SISNIDRAFT_422698 [Sistotremastrum niveocremeum HHB9708]|uniref:C2H2-type domain-containing protein n=2 Tax=Sistotremastraceae TaxID=3402574 RepID=A0A165AA89_9AGAM|nr:hypothetical protein SISNIDRAFT_422698 [Sistotremastrum niveocremeum HHB9708]KZT42477.1 hypothetical protein SISSUDRAFT_999165 [Sistotremastrum suecicum HHB10207 ss-3]